MHSLVEQLQTENKQVCDTAVKTNSSGSLDLKRVADVSGTQRLNSLCHLSGDKGGGQKEFFFIGFEHSL